MLEVPAAVLKQTTKCSHAFSCLQTGLCGSGPMCNVERAHGDTVLCLSGTDWPQCSYHLDFGGARFCVCPVRCVIHQQQAPLAGA